MKKIIGLMALLTLSLNAFAVAVDATSLKMKTYQIAVALDTDCTAPKVIFQSTAGEIKDFLANPTLGSGSLADGTYNCVMITMDDMVTYTSASGSGDTVCVAGTEYSVDICRSPETTDLLTGTTFTAQTCAGTSQWVGVANKVTLYLTTAADGSGGNFKKGGINGIALASPFIVSGAETGIFYLDVGQLAAAVDNGFTGCEMTTPTFGFR